MKRSNRIIKIIVTEIFIIMLVLIFVLVKRNKVNLKPDIGMVMKPEKIEDKSLDRNNKLNMQIENALLNGDETIELTSLSIFKSPDDLFKLLEEATNKNPEIMYYRGAEYSFGKLKINYSKSKEEIKLHQEEIRKIKDNFIKEYIDPKMTEYEKILTVHDYIVNRNKYDNRESRGETLPAEAYSTYGTLALGLSVCEGYAKAMKYLLDNLNIESFIVIGESKGENHAWNLVKIEDEYYHIDSTWNDPVTEDGRDVLRYNYFNLDDDELGKTHTWNREDYLPAKGKKYNYFLYNNLVVNNMEEFTGALEKALLEKRPNITLKFQEVKNIDLNLVLEGIMRRNRGIIQLRAYSYSIDEEHDIMYIEFIN